MGNCEVRKITSNLVMSPPLFGPDLVAQTLEQAQFAGEVTSYENGLSFVTFHGSGHMVPQFRPQSSLHFLKRFLYSVDSEGEELSPLLPSNATLAKLSDDDFGDAMEDWTKRARDMVEDIHAYSYMFMCIYVYIHKYSTYL